MTAGTVHPIHLGSHLGLIALLSFALVRKACLLLPSMLLLGLSMVVDSEQAGSIAHSGAGPGLYPVGGCGDGHDSLGHRLIIVGLWTIWLGTRGIFFTLWRQRPV